MAVFLCILATSPLTTTYPARLYLRYQGLVISSFFFAVFSAGASYESKIPVQAELRRSHRPNVSIHHLPRLVRLRVGRAITISLTLDSIPLTLAFVLTTLS
ncbi:hypothetical protein EI94DRAFT_1755253 [Lactarius quietus]|nr:hypothetical protein EI94DRAFT_1755253 [Lactarius quietus]